ncbi:phosphotransferase [Alteromonas lipolytica]|uniref:Aminoglycoside phosphotransferase domain-containing protein n=1 Tax=Alteromonas lipolytica TaxID=1856405 RepID=A0A1E8FJ09_9ALTE|nr:phosphotransferase [Alteromonas lipolytica]OFI35921.1 hypothetical protein BFC17_09525 [Alteromonas lipolytica]
MVRTLSNQQLVAYINAVCNNSGKALSFEPVRQGLANNVFKASDGQSAWAVKLLGRGDFNTVDYPSVLQLQGQLAESGLAPKVVAFEPALRIWIEQWIETPVAEAGPVNVQLLAEALARIHACKVASPTLALLPCWQHYIEQLAGKTAQEFASERDTLVAVISQYSHYQDFCFCHNDLSFAHLVGEQHQLIVDWEYAATGNRYFDLASCAIINELNEGERMALCRAYAKLADLSVEKVTASLIAFLPVVDFTNRLWTAAAIK